MNRQIKFAIITIVIVIPVLSYTVYTSSQNASKSISKFDSKLITISSFYPLYEFVKKVGQEKTDSSLLVPQGVEPHDWEPTIFDIQTMQQADLIFINGMGFESWIDNANLINSKIKIVDTSMGIPIKKNKITETGGSKSAKYHFFSDPHIWLNPKMAQIQVQNIANALSKSDPKNKDYYQKNAQSYINELEILDIEIRNTLSECKHDFIASHNSFSYFADEYNLTQHSITASNDPQVESTPKTLEKIINLAREYDIKIIFTEEGIDPRTSEIIANEIGGKVLVLSPLEIGDKNFDYVSRMQQNLTNLKEALCR
jgi:zinc transport system substrate-binding protein